MMPKIAARSLLASAVSLLAAQSALAAHWEYKGEHGASHWAEIDPGFKECSLGRNQSPIDIHKTEKTALPALQFDYKAVAPIIWNNGHTVQVNVPSGSKLAVGEQTYDLLQFHFHTPSEETIHGKHYPMVAHFVHKNAAGQLGVVGVLIRAGKPNAALAPIFEHLPRVGEKISVDELSLNLATVLPADGGYYNFEGSLTTPPCSEGVNWMVLKSPIELSRAQIRAFQGVVKFNARPVQPLNGRIIKESQ